MSLYEKLENIIRSNNNLTYKQIAIKLFESLESQTVLNEKELAKISNVSESTISKFLKFIEISNFKHLVSLMKEEIQYFTKDLKSSYERKPLDLFLSWISLNENNIELWKQKIANNSIFNVYCSNYAEEIGSFVYNFLLNLNKKPILFKNNVNLLNKNPNIVENNEINIIIFYGSDNWTLKNQIENLNKIQDRTETLLIISEKQQDKLKINHVNKIVLDFLGSADYFYKDVAVRALFLEIYRHLKK